MKTILQILEEYLRKYPSPTQISTLPGLLKLNYVYSSPYTDSKHTKEVFYPISNLDLKKPLQSNTKRLIYNQKGRIQESQSFDSILIKDKHEKLMQDDIFGKAKHNKNQNKWVYVAQIKQESVKSYFNEGKGKPIYQPDFGESNQDIKQVGIFVWDKKEKKAWRVDIDKQLVPACPSFANEEGTEIIFHAYKKQHFGHGILHCFDRAVSVYHASLALVPKQQKQGSEQKKQFKLQAKIKKLVDDKKQTNIFPTISPCFNYLVYLSGTGITHTYYLDFVIMKKNQNQWAQTHRISQRFVGYYSTLKNYIIKQGEYTFAISQTIQKSCEQIYKINLQTGQAQNITQPFKDYDFTIQEVSQSGLVTGSITTTNFNSFFYYKGNDLQIISPPQSENFTQKSYNSPIPAIYIQAKQEDIHENYRERANKRPLVLIPHGGPHGSFVQALTALRYVLLKLGYGLLMPNFSGSAGYGQQFLSAALENSGQKDAKQIIEVLNKVLEDNPSIDKCNVHVQGGSYGGFMGAILGSRYPQYFKSAIIMNGVLNVIANLWFSDIPEWSTVQTLKKHSLSELTQHHYKQMLRQSPTNSPMKIPTLQFLGAKDRRVPYRQGLFFDAITKQVGTPIKTYVYENSNHGLADSVETSMDILIKSILFLQGIKEEQAPKKDQ